MPELEKLDDKNFNEIMAEAMECLSSLAPEWTDYNAHDPGITFLETLSWLTEIQRYYLEKITNKHELKYLKLLGMVPFSAAPARVTVIFEKVKAVLPKGIQAHIAGIPFTLCENANLSDADIELSYAENGKRQDIYGFMPFGNEPQKGDCFYIHFSEPLDDNAEYNIYIKLLRNDDFIRNLIQSGFYPLAEINIRACSDNFWYDCKIEDNTFGFTQNGVIKIILPQKSFLLCCSLKFCDIDLPPMFEMISLQTSEFIQTEKSDTPLLFDAADNPISLEVSPRMVIAEELSLSEDGIYGAQKWKITDDLSCSGPFDRHFELDAVGGIIKFGDNIHGKAPERNVIINSMSLTLGSQGNVKENLQFTVTANGRIINARTLFTAENGKNPETTENAFKRFCDTNNEKYRAVNADDYIALVKKTPGLCIENAAVCTVKPGKLNICIKPRYGELSDTYIRNIRRYLFDKKLPCIEIDIVPPEFWKGELYAEIIMEKWAADKEKEIRRFFYEYGRFAEKQFGLIISLSNQKRILEAMPFIKKVNKLILLRQNGDIVNSAEDYTLPPNTLLKITKMNIAVKNE